MREYTYILALCVCGEMIKTKLIHETTLYLGDVAIIIEVEPCKVCSNSEIKIKRRRDYNAKSK